LAAGACSGDGLDALQHAYAAEEEGTRKKSRHGDPEDEGKSALQQSVELLQCCRADELGQLERLTGAKKLLAVYRSAARANPQATPLL
jgi:hypothetical protein